MVDNYTIKNVSKDLGFLLSLTKVFGPNENNYWSFTPNNDPFIHKLDSNDPGKPIAIFQDPLPKEDVHFFNPFAEGFGKKSPATQFFYKSIRLGLNMNMRQCARYIVNEVAKVKESAQAGIEYTLSPTLVRMSSVPIGHKTTLYDIVDDKFVTEMELMFDRSHDEFIHHAYYDRQVTAKLKCDPLTDPLWDEKFGKDVRKKSLAAFKTILMGILGITKPEDLDQFTVKYDPDLKSSPKFHAIMSLYLKVYSRFNDILSDAFTDDDVSGDRATIDLGELVSVIDRFPMAYAIAKHMIQPVVPSAHPTSVETADTAGLQIGASSGATRRFAGPEVIDDLGRRSRMMPPLQIGSQPNPQQGRFQPHVIQNTPVDPFAPAVRQTQATPSFGNGGFGQGGSGGYFGNSGSAFGSPFGGGGFNANAPSNFNAPGTRRYFG